jgi:hypothetical protein
MPRIQLWNSEKGNDYHYQDRLIREAVNAGGTSIYVHKYLGPASQGETGDPAQPNLSAQGDVSELDIQDLLFLENRDRIYDTTIYELRGTYNVADQDFDLSQFGLFLSADTVFITFHTNDMAAILGRKLMAGDVIELPHLNDDLLLDATKKSINKFYVVNDASRAAEGFGPTWWPHLWRIKAAPMMDAQEYRGILGDPEDEDSLKNSLSTYQREIDISEAIIASSEVLVPNSGLWDDSPFAGEKEGTEPTSIPDSGPVSDIAVGGLPDKGLVNSGLSFPNNAEQQEFFIRSDFVPNRLFQFIGKKWLRVFDSVEEVGFGGDLRPRTVVNKFINNDAITRSSNPASEGGITPEKATLSKVFKKPRTDD